MTVRDIWSKSTCDIFIYRDAFRERRTKLPSGGRLQIEHAELIVDDIAIVTRASESPYLLLRVEDPT